MVAVVNKVLVIGGGFSGMSAAIQMRKAGIQVDLVEVDPNWTPLGAGITVNGPTLRALQTIGVYEEFKKRGNVSSGLDLYTANGSLIAHVPTPKPVGADVKGGGGIMRPELAKILSEATLSSGVYVRVGCTFTTIGQNANNVAVGFTNGTKGTYDLVVGADGLHSKVRDLLFPEVTPPQYIGQSVWRAVLPRPAGLDRPAMWLSDEHKLGVNPISPTHMYIFINENRPEKTHIDESTWPDVFVGLMKQFPNPFVEALIPFAKEKKANIDHRPLGNLLVPLPWNRGRVVLIGDAVAATTPHLASGAGIGIESGIVLAEELGRRATLQDALDHFHERRWDRCRLVVGNSEKLCMIEAHGGDKQEHATIMRDSTIALTAPI
jgi:2-polyprenyl-6-methoxyphenol hydroxylase-like FAD-dependent oxidoreductase